jgi:hypothetical protein
MLMKIKGSYVSDLILATIVSLAILLLFGLVSGLFTGG